MILETQNISRIYGQGDEATKALRGITFGINKGESVAIIGKSGSGKSTLMHILATLDKPTEGKLIVDGKDTTGLSSKELDFIRNKKFGFVFQQFFLNGRNNCLENVTLPLVIMGIPGSERKRLGLEMLRAVGLEDKATQKANDLSGGQKQRLVIARALVTNPEVVFADEPTGNLDTENGQIIIDLLFRLQKEKGITLIIVTHDPDIARHCDRIVTIKDGEIQ